MPGSDDFTSLLKERLEGKNILVLFYKASGIPKRLNDEVWSGLGGGKALLNSSSLVF